MNSARLQQMVGVGFHPDASRRYGNRRPPFGAFTLVEVLVSLMLLRPTWSDPAVRERLRAASRQRLAGREF